MERNDLYPGKEKKIQLKVGFQGNTNSLCTLRARQIPTAKIYGRFFLMHVLSCY